MRPAPQRLPHPSPPLLAPVLLALLIGPAGPFSGTLHAAQVVWSHTYGGAGRDEARAIEPTSDGGYIVAGRTSSSGAGADDGWILKLDGDGNVQWDLTLGGIGNDELHSVRQTASGGYLAAGSTESLGSGNPGKPAAWVVSMDPNANILWERTYGGTCLEVAHSVRELSAGGYIVAGKACGFGGGGSGEAWLLNLDPNGNINVFDTEYGFNNSTEEATDVWEDPNGFLMVGFTDTALPVQDNDVFVVRVTPTGLVQWEMRIGGGVVATSNGDSARAVQQTTDGGWVLAGSTSLGVGFNDIWIVKLSASGVVQWQRSYGLTTTLEDARSIQQTADGGYIVAGYSAVGGSVTAYLVKLDTLGNLQWSKQYAPGTVTRANSVRQTADGGYIVAGFTDTVTPGFNDFWVMKTNGNGEVSPRCIGAPGGGVLQTSQAGRVPTLVMGVPTAVMPTASSATTGSATASPARHCPVNVRVNQDLTLFEQSEPDLARDPGSSLSQVAVYMDDPDPNTPSPVRFPSIGASFTTDAGTTWADRQIRHGCDGADNDFDGFTDEETLCDGLDDDFDTLVDEDPCCSLQHIDPVVAADDLGNFFTTFVAHEPNATSFAGSSFVVSQRSTDGGSTWTTLPVTAASPYGPDVAFPPGPEPAPFLGEPGLSVDDDPVSAAAGTAYVGWQQDSPVAPANTSIRFASLAPGAGAWSTPVQVNDLAPMECDGFDSDFDGLTDEEICDVLDNDGDSMVDEDLCCQCAEAPVVQEISGLVWVLWRQNANFCDPVNQVTRFFVDESQDGGMTFNFAGQPDRPGPAYLQIPQTLRNHSFRTPGFPSFVMDPLNPVVLYVTFAADAGGGANQADVMFTKSLDGGLSWEPPVRVNDDLSATPQYMPRLAVTVNANSWTVVDIVWYDERNSNGCDGLDNDSDGSTDEEITDLFDNDFDGLTDEDVCDIAIDVYTSRTVNTPSIPSLFTPNRRVTDQSFPVPSPVFPNFLGDSLGLTGDQNLRYATWTDTRNGHNDIYSEVIVDQDSDGDLEMDGLDCSPADPGTRAKPGVIQNIALLPDPNNPANTLVTWMSQDPPSGSATRYDIVSGLQSQLTLDGDYRSSTCLVNDQPNTPYADTRGAPPPGDAFYYVIRAMNPCGSGTFGQGQGRAGLEDGAASLPNPDPCPI